VLVDGRLLQHQVEAEHPDKVMLEAVALAPQALTQTVVAVVEPLLLEQVELRGPLVMVALELHLL
jgi:hypothetical protein